MCAVDLDKLFGTPGKLNTGRAGYLFTVALPGFVARRGKDGNYVMGHSRWTSGPGAAAAR